MKFLKETHTETYVFKERFVILLNYSRLRKRDAMWLLWLLLVETLVVPNNPLDMKFLEFCQSKDQAIDGRKRLRRGNRQMFT